MPENDKSFDVIGLGTANGRQPPAPGQPLKADAIDIGSVKDGKVEFPSWKGDADKPDPPPVPSAPEKRIGFAVAGLGRLSLEQILPAFNDCKYARVTALVSGTPEKAKAVATQYGIDEKATYHYDDMARFADNPDVQAVYVVTPNGLHF